MAIYKCRVCGELYDESIEGVPFDQLPDDWTCPLCGVVKSNFVKVSD
jgi:methylamine---glutamate N-methyltransferase subunit C